jgi:hypothetical protein
MENFRQWLKKQDLSATEGITDTAQIAGFARPVIPGFVRRKMMPLFGEDKSKNETSFDTGDIASNPFGPEKKKKKKK